MSDRECVTVQRPILRGENRVISFAMTHVSRYVRVAATGNDKMITACEIRIFQYRRKNLVFDILFSHKKCKGLITLYP